MKANISGHLGVLVPSIPKSQGYLMLFARRLKSYSATVAAMFLLSVSAWADTPSFSLVGEPQRASDFEYFEYVNPNAPKGGKVVQGSRVTFDTTNGMRFPGKMANELDYIYDTLMVRAEDEPASFYGLLAADVSFTEDFSEVRFQLRPEARWHDGSALTAHDVAFTFQTVAEHGLPSYRSALDGAEIRAVSDSEVVFLASGASDWRMLQFISTFPIFQKSFWETRDVSEATLDVPVGSGPYRVGRFEPNFKVILERVPDYWAADLPVNRGRWNFDQIVTDYFADATIMVEAVRAGEIDVNREYSAANWLNRYDGPALEDGRLVKSSLVRPGGASMSTLVFNLRRPPLDDLRVRRAISVIFDSEFVRDSFSGGLFSTPEEYYSGTRFMPQGAPTERETALLAPFADGLPDGVFEAGSAPSFVGMSKRERLRLANELLEEAGYVISDGRRVNAETGEPLELEYVGANSSSRSTLVYFADALSEIGVSLDVQYFEYITGSRKILAHEWDLTSMGFSTKFPPGQDERLFWHSEKAGEPGYALAGAEDPALDAAIEAMSSSTTTEGIDAAAKAFARVLSWQRYMIPISQSDQVWIAHKPEVELPENYVVRGFHYISGLWARSN